MNFRNSKLICSSFCCHFACRYKVIVSPDAKARGTLTTVKMNFLSIQDEKTQLTLHQLGIVMRRKQTGGVASSPATIPPATIPSIPGLNLPAGSDMASMLPLLDAYMKAELKKSETRMVEQMSQAIVVG